MRDQIVWFPSEKQIHKSKLYVFMQKHGIKDYQALLRRSIDDAAWFWEAIVQDLALEWYVPYEKVLDSTKGWKWAKWFSGGKINLVHNALDRHARGGRRNQVAVAWEGEEGIKKKLTYRELSIEVSRFANGLKSLGVKKGDRVGISMPMTPECVIAILGCSKIGTIFTPIFSGFAAESIAIRLRDCQASVLVTADAFYRRGKIIPMKQVADEAARKTPTVKHCIVHRRLGLSVPWNPETDLDWDEWLSSQPSRCDTQPMDSEDPYMIIYTSGTTGKPKGTIHTHCGFPVKAALELGYHCDLGSSDLLFWITDMGWMMGPLEVAGALTLGSSIFIYDGAPDFPEPNRLWRLIETYGVTALGISPTLVRALMRHPLEWVKKHDLSTLRILASTGEPWNLESWLWYFEQVGGKRCPVINCSGGTEIGGGILHCTFLQPLKPCSFAGPALGMDADVVDENGLSIRGKVGELVVRKPWVSMTRGFWNDPGRYEQTYWQQFPGLWTHGDWARVDEDGFWFIEGRSDDTIKVAGKRIGPAEVESSLTSHPSVLEGAAIGVPHELKGEEIVCFVVLKDGIGGNGTLEEELKNHAQSILGKALTPSKIKFVRDLPKTRNGKIMRRVIKGKYLGLSDMGDLSSLENPSAMEEIPKLIDLKNA